jgi:hypothetical protein
MGKEKEKEFLASWAGGSVFDPARRERAQPRGQAAHMPGRGRGLTTFERRRGGGSRPGLGRR